MPRRDPETPYLPPSPTEANLHEAALRHLARYGTTQAGLTRVLDRRVGRWAAATAPEAEALPPVRAAVRTVVARLVAAGAVDDAAFARSRATGLARTGRSRRAVSAHLAARGVDQGTAEGAMAGGPDELAVAAAAAKRRRIGPYRVGAPTPELERRELGILARAGFAQDVARAALRLERDAAEVLLAALRRL